MLIVIERQDQETVEFLFDSWNHAHHREGKSAEQKFETLEDGRLLYTLMDDDFIPLLQSWQIPFSVEAV
jgi:hypothetical protein